DVSERVAVVELNLSVFLARTAKVVQWQPTSRFPSSDLDLAFALGDDVPAERLERAIRDGAGALLVDLQLFDVYRGEQLGDRRRGLAYRLRLQAPDRNLTDADIAAIRRAIEARASKTGATLR
ncbi:MAG: phenylalanine--tRNA ligase subunit beta, partial [Acidimicrobiia bacterium]|nr:phenylalanine--tRNA ligase subunit beta [Acidimicrobiia bacterium]